MDTDPEKAPSPHPTRKQKTQCQRILWENLVLGLTLVGVGVGFAVGFGVRQYKPDAYARSWIKFPGELFLRVLNLMIIPIIASSVIAGSASLDPKSNGKLSLTAFVYIVLTNFTGALIGVLLVVIIRPGVGVGAGATANRQYDATEAQDIFADLIRNLVPDNIVGATIYKVRTKYTPQSSIQEINNGTHTFNATVTSFTRSLVRSNRSNILGVIVVAFLFGVATGLNGKSGRTFMKFFVGARDATLRIMRWFFWYTPIGVASLIAASVAAITDLEDTFRKLGLFVVCIVVAEALIQFLILPAIHLITCRTNPFRLYYHQLRAMCIVFASTSSAVGLPEMIQACHKSGLDRRVAQFVVPFSITLGAFGSAAFIGGSCIFLGQLMGFPLPVSTVILVWALAGIAVMALPPVPSSSIVSIIIVMSSINIPTTQIGLLLAVEWLLDRLRSASNGQTHVFCAATVNALRKKDLERIDAQQQPDDKVQNGTLQGPSEQTETVLTL